MLLSHTVKRERVLKDAVACWPGYTTRADAISSEMDETDKRMAMRVGESSLDLFIAHFSEINPRRDTPRQDGESGICLGKRRNGMSAQSISETRVTQKEIETSITLKTDKAEQQHATLGPRVHILQSIFIHHSPSAASADLLR